MSFIFETPRLVLRCFTLDDAPLVYSMNSNPLVLQYLHEPLLQDEGHAREILKNIILPQYEKKLGRWAVHTRADNEFIGWCGLKYRAELEDTDLGYRFIPTAWGHGFATEAARYTLHHGFTTLGLEEITGRAHIHNLASIKVLEKAGMEYEADEIIDDCPVKTYKARNPAAANKYH